MEAGIAWIAKLSNPVGAVIEAIRQIYNVVSFVVGQANKIIAFADAVVSSLSQIVHGEIAGAANWIEQALGRMVPLVIEFLAGLVGISSPAPEIRDRREDSGHRRQGAGLAGGEGEGDRPGAAERARARRRRSRGH